MENGTDFTSVTSNLRAAALGLILCDPPEVAEFLQLVYFCIFLAYHLTT